MTGIFNALIYLTTSVSFLLMQYSYYLLGGA